jgi:hypothetical protein
MQCLALTALMSIIWVVCGYTLAFGTPESASLNRYIGDWDAVMMRGIDSASVYVTSADGEPQSGIPTILFAAFQMTFAIITPALMIGAFVERMKFSAVLLFFQHLAPGGVRADLSHDVGWRCLFGYGSDGLCRRNRRSRDRWLGGLGGMHHGGTTLRLSPGTGTTPQHDHDRHRNWNALGWLVWIQCRQCFGGQW